MGVNLLLGVELGVEQWQISECGAQGGDKYKLVCLWPLSFIPTWMPFWALQQSLLIKTSLLPIHELWRLPCSFSCKGIKQQDFGKICCNLKWN
jgi:hypothetical protein